MSKRQIISLLTDFGLQDGFVGTMKGVIFRINPKANIIDISHDIPSGDIDAGAFVLYNAYKYFPKHTIHVVVIDPGVGSNRKAICIQTNNYKFIGPDNGVLKYILKYEKSIRAYTIENKNYMLSQVSQTFHGRDVFAPVAAYLSKGIVCNRVGRITKNYIKGNMSCVIKNKNGLKGNIQYVDKFGNLISNITKKDVTKRNFTSRIGKFHVNNLFNSYALGRKKVPFMIWGSSGFLEIAIIDSSACQLLGIKRGQSITLKY